MKKILIMNNNMQIGGIQRALANLLPEIADKYEVSLFLLNPEGELLKEIPENVRVITANRFVRVLGMSHAQAKDKGFFTMLWRGFLVIMTRIFKTKTVFGFLSRMEKPDGVYDAAISYMQNGAPDCFYGGCAELVLNAVKAEKKICFIHCDFENYEGRCRYNIDTLKRFDKIAAVSDSVKRQFLKVVPTLQDRTVTVHNCYHAERIIKLSKAYEAPRASGKINIFSAARLSAEKGIARMIPILGSIRDAGVDFVWRIAGDGADRENIKGLISQYKLEERVILLGTLDNPYPYFSAADVLLVPSYDEAAPMVFGEAAILNLPIFTTDTASAREMVGLPGIGRVMPNDDKAILRDLKELFTNFNELKFDKKTPNNRDAVKEFDNLIMGEDSD
uniref:Glycosyl transferase n=1 Tax=uncultured Bacillota bacterium TaxID=344338 RepID=A0A650EQN0_9FIRM|nr:glycosyl transferase [uncultured Firmicutes bacterium]